MKVASVPGTSTKCYLHLFHWLYFHYKFLWFLFPYFFISAITFTMPALERWVDVENIVLHRLFAYLNSVWLYCRTFWGKVWEARTSTKVVFSLFFWNISFVQQQHGQKHSHYFGFHATLFRQSVLVCSLLIGCIWVLEMSRDKLVTDNIFVTFFWNSNCSLMLEL